MFCRALEPDSDLKGAVRDGKVFGLGASNMKSGLAAFMIAGRRSGKRRVTLKGDLILAAVAGEISRTPIGPYQSESYRGEGTGTIHLLTHGMQSDYAIVADRSGHSVVWAQNGVAQFKISTFGDPHAAWGVTREEKPPEASSAILKMMKVLQAIDGWAAEFERAHVYHRRTAHRAQGQYRRHPRRRAVPAELLSRSLRDLSSTCARRRSFVRCRCSTSSRTFSPSSASSMKSRCMRPRWATSRKKPARSSKFVEESYQSLFGKKTPAPTGLHASIWTDTNIYNEMGIPAVNSGSAAGAGNIARSKSISRIFTKRRRFTLARLWRSATGTNRKA